jgi:hypothetical protein
MLEPCLKIKPRLLSFVRFQFDPQSFCMSTLHNIRYILEAPLWHKPERYTAFRLSAKPLDKPDAAVQGTCPPTEKSKAISKRDYSHPDSNQGYTVCTKIMLTVQCHIMR